MREKHTAVGQATSLLKMLLSLAHLMGSKGLVPSWGLQET